MGWTVIAFVYVGAKSPPAYSTSERQPAQVPPFTLTEASPIPSSSPEFRPSPSNNSEIGVLRSPRLAIPTTNRSPSSAIREGGIQNSEPTSILPLESRDSGEKREAYHPMERAQLRASRDAYTASDGSESSKAYPAMSAPSPTPQAIFLEEKSAGAATSTYDHLVLVPRVGSVLVAVMILFFGTALALRAFSSTGG